MEYTVSLELLEQEVERNYYTYGVYTRLNCLTANNVIPELVLVKYFMARDDRASR